MFRMGGEMMVVLIVLIAVVGSIIKNKHRRDARMEEQRLAARDPDSDRIRDEIRTLKDRIQVLERVITDTNRSTELDREIERLRDRDVR